MNIYEFFEKTKGKKIRWCSWPEGEYVIPVKINGNFSFIGLTADGTEFSYGLGSGLGKNSLEENICWFFFDAKPEVEVEQQSQQHKCNCPLHILMGRGCQCGGI